jgi:hypothetical protein
MRTENKETLETWSPKVKTISWMRLYEIGMTGDALLLLGQ